MVSRKRCLYTSEIETSTDSDDTIDDQEYISRGKWLIRDNSKSENPMQQRFSKSSSKRAKCSSKNALMARENRLKKKIYIEGLENEIKKLKHNNKTLQSILDNQSRVITELRKEVKYLKSVVANSSDLANLLRAVNCNTGMSVTTSLDKSLTLRNNYVPKNTMLHPWSEMGKNLDLNLSDIDLGIDVFNDAIIPGSFKQQSEDNFQLVEIAQLQDQQKQEINYDTTLKEHNYTVNSHYNESDDVGVCLHVSKHKVSLEFCAVCSEKAAKTWLEVE